MAQQLIVTFKKVTFQKPIVGPREYAAVGASGWPERFDKKEADEHLQTFIGNVTVVEALNNFSDHVELKCDGRCSWTEVTNYLGRITETKSDDIPCQVAIAFWGHMIQREIDKREREQVKGSKKCKS